MPQPEWERYKIADKYAELTTVRHIVHLPVARRIIEDGRIKSGLVFDKSRLNKSRISVTWLSANNWSLGSLYGTVEFQFDWEKLVKHKKIYWVEAMPNYHPPAFRFLMAFEDIASPLVTKYDPEKDDGPLRRVDGTWRWHPDFCSEFMVADDFPLSDISGLDFVRHHQGYCRTKPDCVEKIADPSPQTTSGKLLSYVLAHGVHDLDKHMQPDGNGRNRLLDMASAWLSIVFNQVEYAGSVASNEDCDSVVKGALALFAVDKMDDGKTLLKLIAGSAQAVSALTRLIRIHFGSPTWDFGL
ncbi:hypothetical protein HAP41_0000048090 (plasmid) [Bradyrhizobium barranii subsp. apii]|uniref:Uncharacterized protein n=1 Tax=Bradyrhizobium barranii subsp. apii TaxID=2819348 RepID=A0A8T5VM05_9BRAD|nr:hypothetical protein [Bradyrhizobium barranii]UPT92303.1 hypothetical protein HAP41_0000048090 [Bradyrhizobium barranii subsp. apii]